LVPALRSPIVRVVGSALGIVLLLRSVDLGGVVRDAHQADLHWMAIAAGLTALAFAANVIEWGVLLRSACSHVPWRSLSSWQAQSVFFGHVIPSPAAGDAVRVVNATRVAGGGPGLASLLGSRMASTLGMALWGLAGAVVLRSAFGLSVIAVGAAFALLMIVSWLLALTASRVVHRLCEHSCRVRRRTGQIVRPLTDGFRALRNDRPALGLSIVVGILGWSLNLLSLQAFAHAVSVDVPLTLFAVAVPISLIATLSPVSINGLGLREGVMAALLAHAGVDASHAGSLSLLLDVQMVPIALAGGLLWMGSRRRVRAAGAPAPAGPPAAG
jgi:glycosyltransferase 2 family protein